MWFFSNLPVWFQMFNQLCMLISCGSSASFKTSLISRKVTFPFDGAVSSWKKISSKSVLFFKRREISHIFQSEFLYKVRRKVFVNAGFQT